MAFQFKRDRAQNLELVLAGDIDLEVTPDIKTQLISQLDDANSLTINGKSISYLDSSGVSILIISMQTCKQRQLQFSISEISEEAIRVLQLAKLDKILPITAMTGPAQLVDVDAFSGVCGADDELAHEISDDKAPTDEPMPMDNASDADLIAALSKDAAPEAETMPAEEVNIEMTPDPAPAAEPMTDQMTEPMAEPAAEPEAPAAAPDPSPAPAAPKPGNDDNSSGGGGFTPGTFG